MSFKKIDRMKPSQQGSAEADPLPASAASLADQARPVAAHARPLIAASRATLVSLTLKTVTKNARPLAMCWVGAAQPVPLRSAMTFTGAALDRSLAAFEMAGWRLLQDLIVRWPANAVPPAIGIVTDGDGVVFSSDHPSPLYPDWLSLHQAGLCAPITLLAFSGTGAWSRLTDPIAERRLH